MLAACVAVATMASSVAYAAPAVDFGGTYFRASVGSSRDGGQFTQNKNFLGRLGNESDVWSDIGLGANVFESDDLSIRGETMFALYNNGIGRGEKTDTDLEQLNIQIKGLIPNDPDAVVWGGKRHYQREDIHQLDVKYYNVSGLGGGLEYLQVGPGKLSLAWVRHDFHNQKYINDNGDVLDGNNWLSYHIFDVEYDLPAWDGATLEFRGTVKLPKKDTDNKEYYTKANGSQAMMIELNQGYSLGWNKSVVRYIHGNVDQTGDANSGPTKMGAQYNSIGEDATYNTWSNNSGDKNAYRWQFYNFGETHFTENVGMFHVIAGTFADGYDNNITSKDSDRAFQLVVRPYLKLTKMTRLLAEGGFFTSTDKYIDGSKVNKQVQKLTLAYALTPDAGNFWSRPEIRFYGTYLHSNGAYNLSEWGKAQKNNAFVVGVQAEAWW